jgi:protein CpxP
MKGLMAVRLGITLAATLAAGSMMAQEPGGGGSGAGGPGSGGPGFGMHRPPMERALGGHEGFGRWWNNPKIVEKLKLTDDQRKAMDQIFQEHREKLVDLRGNVEKAEIAMEPLVRADQPNEQAVLTQIDKVAQARAELEKANARFLFALRSKLTPDQWKQVQEFRMSHEGMRREFRERMGRRSGHGPGDGPGDGNDHAAPAPPPGPQGMLDEPEENPATGVNL